MKKEPDPKSLLNRKEAAAYLDTSTNVLAVWDSIKRYDFKRRIINREVYYPEIELYRHKNRQFII